MVFPGPKDRINECMEDKGLVQTPLPTPTRNLNGAKGG